MLKNILRCIFLAEDANVARVVGHLLEHGRDNGADGLDAYGAKVDRAPADDRPKVLFAVCHPEEFLKLLAFLWNVAAKNRDHPFFRLPLLGEGVGLALEHDLALTGRLFHRPAYGRGHFERFNVALGIGIVAVLVFRGLVWRVVVVVAGRVARRVVPCQIHRAGIVFGVLALALAEPLRWIGRCFHDEYTRRLWHVIPPKKVNGFKKLAVRV